MKFDWKHLLTIAALLAAGALIQQKTKIFTKIPGIGPALFT